MLQPVAVEVAQSVRRRRARIRVSSHILALRSHLLMMAIVTTAVQGQITALAKSTQTAQTAAIVHHRQQLPTPHPCLQGYRLRLHHSGC